MGTQPRWQRRMRAARPIMPGTRDGRSSLASDLPHSGTHRLRETAAEMSIDQAFGRSRTIVAAQAGIVPSTREGCTLLD